MVMEKTQRAGLNWQRLGLRVAGAGLLAATGAIHLDLYLTGYRSIPVIGWLFLLQVIAAFGLAAASVAALVLLAVAVAGAGGPGASAAGGLRTAKIGGMTVLTNAKGFTLYSFAPDTPSRSNCTGTCAGYWPPVTGTPAAGPGVTGKLGTIKRSDGTTQAVYNGHPLYTYIADTVPGQAHGNNLNLNGGLWHEVTVSG
jgi:predicted lipoprotein with Yx(FWY)xxD motif